MVAECAGCNHYQPWAALIIGGMGGVGFITIHHAMLRAKLDDPLDAVGVHGAGGMVGILSVPIFMHVGLEEGERGILWDGDYAHPWLVLVCQAGGALAIILWSAFWCFILFGAMHCTNILRVEPELEILGMDLIKHGEAAYPAPVSKVYLIRYTNN